MSTSVAKSGWFVGREPELATAAAALDSARASSPRILVIEGEAGIGKTAFVHRFLSGATDVIVLAASGDETEAALEYGVISQLVSRASSDGSAGALSESLGAGSAASVFGVGAELLMLLGSLQDRAPVALVIDDAHWLDPSSAGALLFALRRLFADRVLAMIVTRLDGDLQLGPGWRRLLSDPARTDRVTLRGFDAREVGLLADSLGLGVLPLVAAERLREHTDGHPLYTRALLRELPAEALTFDYGPLPAPHSFAATVIARLAGISVAAQDLVAAAAVAGTRCPLWLAGTLAGLGDPLPALEEALAGELLALVPARIPEELTFAHPLVRAAVYDDLSPSRRRGLHLRCAALTSGAVSLAHRVAATSGTDDGLADELGRAGEERAAEGRLVGAAENMLWASRVASSSEVREGSLLRAVECLQLAGEVPRAQALRDSVLACSNCPHRSFIVAVLTASGGRLADAADALEELIQRPELSVEPGLLERVTASLAILCALLGRGADAVAWARRALDREGVVATARVTAMQALAQALLVLGRGDEGIDVLSSASPSRISPEPFEAELLTTRGNLKAWWGDLAGAVEDLEAVIGWSRAGSPLRSLPNAYGALSEAEYRLGRWDDALAHGEVAVSLAEDTDRGWDLPVVHAVASFVHAGRGNWGLAAEHASSARRAARTAHFPMASYYSHFAGAHLAWMRGEWESVLSSLGPLRQCYWKRGSEGLGQRAAWLLEAEALLCSDRIEEATQLLDEIERAMAQAPLDVTGIDLWRLRALLELALRRPSQARAAFHAGQEAARAVDSPFAEAKLELAHGVFLRKAGNRQAASGALRVARERFEQLRATPFVERCDAELAACGLRPRSRSAHGDYGLTAREQAVAVLVASGKSNREVAAELYLSTKAVEYHLRNIFAKVGIHSRHQLSARLPGVMLAEPVPAGS
ncbi:MAG: AAA family ATPase [Chloroflexi bacterium]|nr:AAA family ATPase [Chloroflexota bacterium]